MSHPDYFDWVRQETKLRKRLKPWTLAGTGDVLWIAVKRTPYWRKRTAKLNRERAVEIARATALALERIEALRTKLLAGLPLEDGTTP